MDIIALKKTQYGGRSYSPGDKFSARSKDAKALVYIGRAIYAPVLPPVVKPVVVEEAPPKKKYTYKRRDLTAESVE